MPSYLHPGVYLEEIPSGSKPIEAVGTSTACFIGYTVRGPNNNQSTINAGKLNPTLISKWDAYDSEYGGIRDTNDEETPGDLDQMGQSVYAFFRNGGIKAYIIRIAIDDLAVGLAASSGILANAGSPPDDLLTFTAINEGTWGNSLVIQIVGKSGQTTSDTETANDFVSSPDSAKELTIEIGSGTGDDFSALEVFTNISMDPTSDAYILHKINDGSTLVSVSVESGSDAEDFLATMGNLFDNPTASPPVMATPHLEIEFEDGGNGSPGGAADYDEVFNALLKYRDVNIICLPGLFYDPAGKSIIDSAVSHCETMKNRMVIVDPPPNTEFGNEKQIQDQGFPTSTYAALYYPWVKVRNRYYDADTRPGVPTNLLVQPSGFAAGMWAKVDGKRGVWKAPAGVETRLLGAAGFEYVVEDAEQDYINPMGVCAFRTLPNYGQVIWGARTLATKADPEWRYIPVRRTAMLIEESIYNGIQWAVFEPNDHRLWGALRGNIGSFMNGLFRAGAFQGEKASDAYFVRCGLGDTMVQADIDRGQVIAIVGFAPLKPAEFVIVRIQQKIKEN